MAKKVKMEQKVDPSKVNPRQVDPDKAMGMFQDKWNKMNTDERLNTLLDMVLNAGFKLDMLATAVYTEPTMKEHLDTFSNKINKKREDTNGNND